MQFDANNPYHRYRFHYESDHQLSVPELIARNSVDAATAALVWHLVEHRASYIISGPTDPTPGVGKTTTLNALLPFYPAGTGLVYTLGGYEDFAFIKEVPPAETTVLANEVSDHLSIYMWGRNARKFLRLPAQGFAIATSCHADTLKDVLAILTDDLRLTTPDIQQLQVIVNIGLRGRVWPQKRRWLTTHFVLPASADPDADAPTPLMISCWEEKTDTFLPADDRALTAMAAWTGETPAAFQAEVQSKTAFLTELATRAADHRATMLALRDRREG